MAFKADSSFLRFLTMGALASRTTISYLQDAGFSPIELERYCGSNKIWTTKVKRLRLPDLLCVRTGTCFEVRGKADLSIKMSDAPDNADRRWDVGLDNRDIVAFVPCNYVGTQIRVAGVPSFFSIGDLRHSVETTVLGQPKSASEGAERDREWPSTVPSQDGVVTAVMNDRIIATLASGRRQHYLLRGKYAYVAEGEPFIGNTTIIAGTVPKRADLGSCLERRWDCVQGLESQNAIERYASVKAIPYKQDLTRESIETLIRLSEVEEDLRIVLESHGSQAKLNLRNGWDGIDRFVWEQPRVDLRMEAVLILSEIKTNEAAARLVRIAASTDIQDSEIRQAAVWGLGWAGTKRYDLLLPFISDDDENVALHALCAYSDETPRNTIVNLVNMLNTGSRREQAAASLALSRIRSEQALVEVFESVRSADIINPWLLTTVGQFPSAMVYNVINDEKILKAVSPLLLLGSDENWLATASIKQSYQFLSEQNI